MARTSLNFGWLLILLLEQLKGCSGGPYEKELLNDLFKNYNVQNRPVLNESSPIVITFGVTLQQIVDLDEKNQLLTTCMWFNLVWTDYQLAWNTSEYGGVDSVVIQPRNLWIPDILLYNSADERFDGTFQTNIVASSDGSMLYVPPGIFKSTCKIDITWFPFDDQNCELKFGSWTYNGFKLDLKLQFETGGDLSNFMENGEWSLLDMPGKRNNIVYECCPEPYVDITFTINMRRRTLYYFFNLIVPCVLISSMALLGFTLPPDAGEKLTLGVTVMLSLTVFMNIVSELMPITSDAVPLIGTYFNFIMGMVASSVLLTVLVLNYHHRHPETHDMPTWIKRVFLQWLPWLLRYHRPNKKITIKSIMMENKMASKISKFSSVPSSPIHQKVQENGISNGTFRPISGAELSYTPVDEDHGCHTHYNYGSHSSISHNHAPIIPHHCCPAARRAFTANMNLAQEVKLILREIRFLTKRVREKDEEDITISDWKFAAMVIDRFCLIGLSIYTVMTTVVLFISAPHLIVK